MPRITAWSYESDIHCPDCACERFGEEPLTTQKPAQALDSDGNTPHPIFSTSDDALDQHCGSCRQPIDS